MLDTCQWLIGQVVIKTNRSDKTEIKKIIKNQRPPAEVAPASSRGILILPALLVVADFYIGKIQLKEG